MGRGQATAAICDCCCWLELTGTAAATAAAGRLLVVAVSTVYALTAAELELLPRPSHYFFCISALLAAATGVLLGLGG